MAHIGVRLCAVHMPILLATSAGPNRPESAANWPQWHTSYARAWHTITEMCRQGSIHREVQQRYETWYFIICVCRRRSPIVQLHAAVGLFIMFFTVQKAGTSLQCRISPGLPPFVEQNRKYIKTMSLKNQPFETTSTIVRTERKGQNAEAG